MLIQLMNIMNGTMDSCYFEIRLGDKINGNESYESRKDVFARLETKTSNPIKATMELREPRKAVQAAYKEATHYFLHPRQNCAGR